MATIPDRPDNDLKQLAKDLHLGLVFTDRHIKQGSGNDIGLVFMPLIFMPTEKLREIASDIGLVYEYLDKAGPRTCNGLPNFASCNFLNKEDAEKVIEYYEKIKAAVESAVPSADTPTK